MEKCCAILAWNHQPCDEKSVVTVEVVRADGSGNSGWSVPLCRRHCNVLRFPRLKGKPFVPFRWGRKVKYNQPRSIIIDIDDRLIRVISKNKEVK